MSHEGTSGMGITGEFRQNAMAFLPYTSLAEQDTPHEHSLVMAYLDTYLALVPVGVRDKDTDPISPRLRAQLFDEREHSCEACNIDVTDRPFDVHHTDYTQGSNPEYLRLLCKPCHNVVGVLTGMKWWFAQKVGLVEKQERTRRPKGGNANQIPFWMEDDFVKYEPVEED